MEKTRFGLYGYGKVAQLHARALATCENAQLVSVCGRDIRKASAFAVQWGIQARDSAQEMADRDKAEAVIVTTPHPLHPRVPWNVCARGSMSWWKNHGPQGGRLRRHDRRRPRGAPQPRSHKPTPLVPSTRRIKTAIDQGLIGSPLSGR